MYIMVFFSPLWCCSRAPDCNGKAPVSVMLYIVSRTGYGVKALANRFAPIILAAAVLFVSACADKADNSLPTLTAKTLGEQTVLPAWEYLLADPYAGADRVKGEKLARTCRACHSLGDGGADMIGPALYSFFGSQAGSRDDYDYSSALREATFFWTPRALDAWLAQPGQFLIGNRMSFAGIMARSDRDDLIAYLLDVTTADGGS